MKTVPFSAQLRFLSIAILFSFPSSAAAFDQRLAGVWQTDITNAAGTFRITWTIAGDGKYEVRTTGPAITTRELGVLTAGTGRWSKESPTGLDGGSYIFETNDRLTVRGAGGTLTWARSSAVPPTARPAASETAQNAEGPSTDSAADRAQSAHAQAAFDEGSRIYKSGDEPGSFPYFVKAAQQGHAGAQLQVGWHYENGVGVARDDAQAAMWYEKSALAGDATAMKNMGQMYELGQGVRQDWLTAADWYRKSAERGDRTGAFALARAYRFGIGVHQNRAEAIRWYTIAAEHGEPEAADDARWLSDPTNNIGFRNAEEHRLVMNNQLRFSSVLHGADPAGIRFRNAKERENWLVGLRAAVDKDEEETRRELARRAQERESAVKSLMEQGYSRSEAEAKAPY